MANYGLFQFSQQAMIIRGGKVLILRFAGGRALWGFPGGRVDDGEYDKEASFSRELEEEIGLKEYNRIGVVDYVLFHSKTWDANMIGMTILIETNQQEFTLSHEHTEMAWVGLDDLDQYEFSWPKAKEMIQKGIAMSKTQSI